MMKAKKVLSLLVTAALAAGVLTGCGGGRETEETAQTAETPAAAEETAETESAETAEPEEAAEEETAGGGERDPLAV